MSWSEKKTDAWGNEYTQHYDDSGNKIGWSETKTDAWGSSNEQHYDQDGSKPGWSESKTDAWGDSYSQHYDSDGGKSGWSESKTDAWSDNYEQHYDQGSTKRGWSESKTDAWGDRYEQGYDQDGSKSGERLHGRPRLHGRSSAASRSGGTSGGGGFAGASPSSGSGGGFAGASLSSGSASVLGGLAIIAGFVLVAGPADIWLITTTSPEEYSRITAERNRPVHDSRANDPSRTLTQQEVDNPAALSAAIPSGNMTWGEYAITHRFVRYDRPRILYARGRPSIGWNVPMHVGPTTISAKLADLSHDERVTSQGSVEGPDGRTWEVVTRDDGTLGFALQRDLRLSPARRSSRRDSGGSAPKEALSATHQIQGRADSEERLGPTESNSSPTHTDKPEKF